jgi:hypothetical protein
MSRRLIGRIVDGQYQDMESLDVDGAPSIRCRFGPERTDPFSGVKPSDLRQLDGRQLFMAANRLYDSLAQGKGTRGDIDNDRSAYDSIIREARGRRATLHD